MNTFLTGAEIREKRQQLGLTQKEVIEHLGLTDPTNVSDWECGRRQVPEKHHKSLLAVLEMPDDLQTRQDNRPVDRSRDYGIGACCVYLFYNPRDKQDAETKGENIWACNIGSTQRTAEDRVKEQTDQWTVPPVIALRFRDDDINRSQTLEGQIQQILKLFDRQRTDLKGREWFQTSPDEVEKLYLILIR